MSRVQTPEPGRLIISIIYSSMDGLADALKVVERKFSRVQCETTEIPCSSADRYLEEMGHRLSRRFFSFERPVLRDSLPEIKQFCHKTEPRFADRHGDYSFRTVNIDPGLLTAANLIVASHREYNHRIYLRDGVWAEIALIYSRNRFTRLPWTSPDYCHSDAIEFFERVRQSLEMAEPVLHT